MRKIPTKNYLLLAALTLFTILFVICINGFIKTYKFNKMNISPLTNNVSEVNKNELHLSLAESNQIILYVGYKNNNEIKKLEKEILKKIKSKNLNEYVIYYDVTEELKNDRYLDTLKSEFPNMKDLISKSPIFIYIKNGEAIEAIDSKEKLISIDDFNYLVDKYEVGK